MKNIIYTLLVGLLTVSCQLQSPYRQSLAQAEQIMDEHPDSAYFLLKDIPAEILSAREYAEWGLLLTQSMDKLYMPHTSDSLIRAAAAYFEKRGNAVLRTKAYYYVGRVSQELEDTFRAQEYYLKALGAGKSSGNDRLSALIRSNLGMLYTYQGVHEEALPQMEEAARLFGQLGDTVNRAYVLRDIGRTCHVMDSIDLAIRYYEQALEGIGSYGRPSVLNELGNLHIEKKSYNQAEFYLRESLNLVSADDYQFVALTLGRLFAETDRPDSARFYLNVSIGSSWLSTKAGGYYYLGNLLRNEKEWEESTEALNAYLILHDSIMKQRNAESIRKIQSLFNFKQIEEERNRALQQTIKIERTAFLSILISMTLAIMLFYRWIKGRRHKKAREELLQRYKEQTVSYNQTVKALTSELENQIGENEKLNKIVENIAVFIKKDEEKKADFKKTDIYHKLREQGKTGITKEDQDDLYATLDRLWPEFRPSFRTLSTKVSEQDILMCCLLKADLKPSTVALYMSTSKSAVSNRRSSLAKKLFGEKATVEDLDNFIFYKKIPREVA